MKQKVFNKQIKSITLAIAAVAMCAGVTAQAQVIDPLTGSLSGYTTYSVLENSDGGGDGLSFTDSGSGLQDNYVGATSDPEQALFLAPVTSFSSTFAVGDMLTVDVNVPTRTLNNSLTEDFGLAISDNNPSVAGSGNGYNSRTAFDWASVSVRPDQQSIRENTSVSGTLTTSANVVSEPSGGVSELFIEWVSADAFNLGFYDTSDVQHITETVTFAGGSAIGADIGFYGDLRAPGQTVGDFTDLTISTIPEPSALALCGIGLVGLLGWKRRK
jgi:PEP-CTERM motif